MTDYKSNNTYKTLKNGYQIFTTNHKNVTRENYDSTQDGACIKRGFKCKPLTDTCCAPSDVCFGYGSDDPTGWCVNLYGPTHNNVCDQDAPPGKWNPKGGCTFNDIGGGGTACSACCKKPPMPPSWTGDTCDQCWVDAVNAGNCK